MQTFNIQVEDGFMQEFLNFVQSRPKEIHMEDPNFSRSHPSSVVMHTPIQTIKLSNKSYQTLISIPTQERWEREEQTIENYT